MHALDVHALDVKNLFNKDILSVPEIVFTQPFFHDILII